MPYYHWKGVDLAGQIKAGRVFSASTPALDLLLFKRDIALISWKILPIRFLPSITKETIMQFFERLATLLRAGVLVPEALVILRDTMGHVRVQILIDDIVKQVERGTPLHKALATYPDIFDERMIQMVYIGQETGSLPITVAAIASYLETVLAFRAKVKAAAMMPLISFLFFLAIVAVIIVGIIPTFASVFSSVNQPLPMVTRSLLAISDFLRSWQGLVVVGLGSIVLFWGVRWLFKRPSVKQAWDVMVINMPYVRDITYDTQRAWFLDSLVLLVKGGMPLVPALSIAERSCVNSRIYSYVATISNAVALGSPLSIALEQCPGGIFAPESIAIIAVGENIGQLVSALSQTAEISRTRAARSIAFITTVIQPLLLIILGLMIMLLILAVYAPIFTLSWAI